eukprot:6546372-Pyramimonas_sp.AAC.1
MGAGGMRGSGGLTSSMRAQPARCRRSKRTRQVARCSASSAEAWRQSCRRSSPAAHARATTARGRSATMSSLSGISAVRSSTRPTCETVQYETLLLYYSMILYY